MEILAYVIRCIFTFLVTWTSLRLIGKKSIANMTSYDFAAVMLLTSIAVESLVYEIASKATVGVITIAIITVIIDALSLKKHFYNVDLAPIILVADGKMIKETLKRSRINIP